MLQTELGRKVSNWSPKEKSKFKNDLDKLTNVPLDVLSRVVETISKTYPACNIAELTTLEAEQRGVPDREALQDATTAFAYIMSNIDGESPQALTEDLISLDLISSEAARLLSDFLVLGQPFRESAEATSSYLRVGSALFASIRGTVDIRLRFHRTSKEFESRALPTTIVGAQQVIMADLIINRPEDEEAIVSFLMDENDLNYMKRFVSNMERELELSRGLLKHSEQKTNG